MTEIRLNVPMVRQEMSPVCWLACATMVLQFQRGRSVTDAELAYPRGSFRTSSVHGFDANIQTYRHMERLGFRTHYTRQPRRPTMGIRLHGAGRRERIRDATDVIIERLSLRRPLVLFHRMGTFSYGPGQGAQSGGYHAVVITGIDTERGAIFFHNPWGQSDVPTTTASILGAVEDFERRKNYAALLTYGR